MRGRRRTTSMIQKETALEEVQRERETGVKYRRLACVQLAATLNATRGKTTTDTIFDAQRLFEFVEDGALTA